LKKTTTVAFSMTQPRVLIIDALNMYFRAYIVDPSLSTNGQPIGGMKGFLKILQKQVRETKPDQIVIAWDGPGGSQKRKSMDKGYKEGRKPIRLNRDIRNLSENEEIKNKVWQQTRLAEYLNQMPISQIMLPAIEADDVIAYVTTMPSLKGWQKIIVSSDKDFFQLCDDETILYRPIQKAVLNKHRIVEEHGIHPLNFALARAIVGDKSDNLRGVGGAGLPTVAKRFPFLSEEKNYVVQDVIEHCEDTEKKLKVHQNILEHRSVIEKNYKMMQLYVPMLSPQSRELVRYAVEEAPQEFNKTEVLKMMTNDGFGAFDWSSLFQTMKRIVVDNKEGDN
jgi:DNA polymerase-1